MVPEIKLYFVLLPHLSSDLLISKVFHQSVREGKGIQWAVLIFDYSRSSAYTHSNDIVSDDWTPF